MRKITLATFIISIGISLVGCSNSNTLNNETESKAKVTIEEAKEIALNHANLTSDEVSFIRTETETDNGVEKYDIEFYCGNKEYDYEINASNGEVISCDYDVENYEISEKQETDSNESLVTIDEAKQIALKHANLTSDEVSFIRTETEIDNGVKKYDIEFYYGNKEYDYEVNALNGEIISYDYDVENYNISGNQGSALNESSVTIDEAKQIALNHANLTSDQVSFIKSELDVDNGVKKYDIEFYYGNKEYDYEIDANTGNILKYEQD